MTWTFDGHRGSANNKTSGTQISVNPTGQINPGKILVVRCVADNYGTTSGESTEHSVADSQGNSYTKVKEWRRSSGAAADGVVSSLFISKIQSALSTSDTVTLTLSNAVTAKAIGLEQFSITGIGISVTAANGAQGSSAYPSATLSSAIPSAEYLWLGGVGIEGPNGDTFTQDTDYANNTSFGTTGGSGVSNVACRFGSRVYTGTNDTYNPTIETRDWVCLIGAIKETLAVSKSFSDSGGGADSFLNPYRGVSFVQSGAGADAFGTPFRSMGFLDSVSCTDVFALLRMLNFTDGITGSDVFNKEILAEVINKYFTDTIGGADVFTIIFKSVGFSETASGIDAFQIVFRSMGFFDSGLGSDTFSVIFREVRFSDTIQSTDQFVTSFRAMGFSDAVQAVDSFSLFLSVQFSDTGYGSEIFTQEIPLPKPKVEDRPPSHSIMVVSSR